MFPGNKIVVSRGSQYRFPNFCAICLRPGPTERLPVASDEGKLSGYYVVFTSWRHLVTSVPVCAECRLKEKRLQKIAQVMVFIGLIAGVGIAIKLDLDRGWVFLLGVVMVAPGVLASELMGKPVRIGRYNDQTVEFAFKSPEYAKLFKQANESP
jgi:hypothetical protein